MGACLVATNVMTGAIPWLTKVAVDEIQAGAPISEIGIVVGGIVLTAMVMAVIRVQSRLQILGVSRRVAYDLRREIFEHLLKVRSQEFDRMSTGDVMSRITNDLMLVRGLTGPGFMYGMNTLLAYATSLSLMTVLDPYLTLLAMVPFPFFLVSVWFLARRLHVRQRTAQERLADMSSRVQEDLNGIWVVKAHAREDFVIDAFEEQNRACTEANMKLVAIRSILNPVMSMVGGFGSLLVLVLGGMAVIDGKITLGGFVAFTGYLAMIAGPTVNMGWVITLVQRARVATQRIEALLALPSEDARVGQAKPLEGGLELAGLTFTYPSTDQPVFSDLDLSVPSGRMIGVWGPTGSGKSTILKVLTRLYEGPPGASFLGGVDLARAPLGQVRRSISYVPQDPFLFRATVAENIAFGSPEIDMARVEAAARAACIHDEIAALSQGYQTEVGERGVTLSGGQRARVTLARALYQRRPLLLLDDPFASVDVRTEHQIIENLRREARGITTLLVSHRVKALAETERIFVLDGGRIVDSGPHDELLEREGPYLEAFREQRLVEELAELS